MASLSTVLGHLSTVIGTHQTSLEPLHRTRRDIVECLNSCYTPDDIQRWHLTKMKYVRDNANEQLATFCTNVAASLFKATKKAARLRNWATGVATLPVGMTARQYLNAALNKITLAFKEFSAVPKTKGLCTTNNMEMIHNYLAMVYEIMIVLMKVAFPPHTISQSLNYWIEYLDATDLEGFLFDDMEMARSFWVQDRTLRGVLPALEATPETYLPSNSTHPVVFRREGPYGAPVLKNALFTGKEGFER